MPKINLKNAKSVSKLVKSNDKYKINSEKKLNRYMGKPIICKTMGTKVRKDGETVEGVDLYMGGKVGKDAKLGDCVRKKIACDDLKSTLRDISIEQFDAKPL